MGVTRKEDGPLDFEEEQRLVDENMHWAIESESQLNSDRRRALRRLEDERRGHEGKLEEFQQQSDHLLGIIEGKIRPAAVDLPETEASDFRTKLRLRVKGVRGIAIERAREELIPIEKEIEDLESKIERIQARVDRINAHSEDAMKAITGLQSSVREQRKSLRDFRGIVEQIQLMVEVFGWYEPYCLSRKSFVELMISKGRLRAKCQTLEKREEEIADLGQRISDLKNELQSVLGDAYEGSLMPLIFKEGRSPAGRRYIQNQLTVEDVESLDIAGKIEHHKSLGRKADRLSSVLRNHRHFIEELLLKIAELSELRTYYEGLLNEAVVMEKAARRLFEAKRDLHNRIILSAEDCGRVRDLRSRYSKHKTETESIRQRAVETIGKFRSDL